MASATGGATMLMTATAMAAMTIRRGDADGRRSADLGRPGACAPSGAGGDVVADHGGEPAARAAR